MLKFLELIAEKLEDTAAPHTPITLVTRWGTRTTLLDSVSGPRVPLSPTHLPARSRENTAVLVSRELDVGQQ